MKTIVYYINGDIETANHNYELFKQSSPTSKKHLSYYNFNNKYLEAFYDYYKKDYIGAEQKLTEILPMIKMTIIKKHCIKLLENIYNIK